VTVLCRSAVGTRSPV